MGMSGVKLVHDSTSREEGKRFARTVARIRRSLTIQILYELAFAVLATILRLLHETRGMIHRA